MSAFGFGGSNFHCVLEEAPPKTSEVSEDFGSLLARDADWDGDVFVVETTGLRDGGWLDTRKGRPHSDALHLTERFRRTDFGHMDLTIVIDDPKAYLKPWTATTKLSLRPDTELLESFCDNHDKSMEHRSITPAPPEPPSPPR